MEINNSKIAHLCRACNGEFREMKSIFEKIKGYDMQLADMLMACASVKVSETDGLPTSICRKCIIKLKSAFNFKIQCEKTDENLRQTFESNEVKQENDDSNHSNGFAYDENLRETLESDEVKQENNGDNGLAVSNVDTENLKNISSPKPNNVKVKKEESSNESEYSDSNDSKQPVAYSCKLCLKQYSSVSKLNRHVRVHFPAKKTYTCKICFKSLLNKQHLISHIISNHVKMKPCICPTCKRGFVNEDSLYKHSKKCKGQKPFVCPLCSQGFIREDSLQLHLHQHDAKIVQKNPTLDSIDDIESYIQVDEERDNTDQMLKFLIDVNDVKERKRVKEAAVTKPRKKTWKQKRVTNDTFTCRICDQTFIGPFVFKQHMLNEHQQENPFKCDVCKKSFPRHDHFLRHSKTHLKGKRFACDQCPKKFSCESLLQKHTNAKHGVVEKKFECSICNKSFSTEERRTYHLREFCLKDQPLRCKRCEKEFPNKDELVKHLKLANECSRRFLCSDCGQRFSRNEYLTVHMRRHTGERPFKCSYCDKAFSRTSNLQSHEKSHTGEKPHLCIICGKGFARAYMLTVHMRTHPGKKPYVCEFCEAAFVYNGALKTHIRETHPHTLKK